MLYPNTKIPNDNNTPPNDWESLNITLKDIKPEVFKALLTFIYTDNAEIDVDTVDQYMAAAHKYGIDGLAMLCTSVLDEGVTIDTACSMFEASKKLGSTVGMEFIEKNTKKVLQTEGFLDLSEERLVLLLKSDNLRVKEVDLFNAVMKWGEKRATSDKTTKEVVSSLIPLLRFPLCSVGDFAQVAGQGVLTQEQTLELYTYIACVGAKSKNLPKISFSAKKRGSGGFSFVWDRIGTNGRISDSGLTVTSNSSSYCCALGSIAMPPNSGDYFWECKVNNCTSSNSWMMGFGLGTSSLGLDNYISANTSGWGFINHSVRAHSNSSGDTFAQSFGTGDTIGLLYKSDSGVLKLYKNKKDYGALWSDIRETVYPAVHVAYNASLTMIADPDSPDS